MAEERLQRRLAAILTADVVGYSRLLGIDEAGTLARLKALRRDLPAPQSRAAFFQPKRYDTPSSGRPLSASLSPEFISGYDDVNMSSYARKVRNGDAACDDHYRRRSGRGGVAVYGRARLRQSLGSDT
jgi:hypothetical protein